MSGRFFGQCLVKEKIELTPGVFRIRLEAPEIAEMAEPGQFVMVQAGADPAHGAGPLLKRPISLHRIGADGHIELLFRMVGVGTRLLSHVQPGARLELLGPVGRGFDLEIESPHVYLAAGGMGVAPMPALASAFAGKAEVTLFYGAVTASELITQNHPDYFGPSVKMVSCTDDCTFGLHGLVTAPLSEALRRFPAPVLACGPKPMLAEVAALAEKAGVPAQVSLEAHMACGVGACLGCVVERRPPAENQYARVCAEGPVFDAREIKWI